MSPWEAAADAWIAYERRDNEAAADEFRRVVEEHPNAGGLVYNLACCEALAGRGDEAIAHLRRAIELEERFRELAVRDEDFDPIRDRSDFP